MSSFILIGASVLLSMIVAHLIIQRFNLLKPFNKGAKNIPVFISTEEALKIIPQKADLTEEETEHLKTLFALVSGNRLHQAFEEKDVADKWMIAVRRAIVNNSTFDQDFKEDLEYTVYEIYRKINNIRMITHPSVKYVSDLNVGQPVLITFANEIVVPAVLEDYGFYTFSLKIDTNEITNIPKNLDKKKVRVSLWKKMDAQYSFISRITATEKKNKIITLVCSNPKNISCSQIRSFPRQDAEIPVKFRQAVLSMDPNSGGMKEEFGSILFGIINNISPWGCSLISYTPIPIHTIIKIKLPLFHKILSIKGTVKNLSKRGEVFVLNVEFTVDTPKNHTLTIYHYLFAEDSANK